MPKVGLDMVNRFSNWYVYLQGLALATKEAEAKELQAKLHQTELNNTLQQDLLRHMMQDNVNIEADDLMTHSDADGKYPFVFSQKQEAASPGSSVLRTFDLWLEQFRF